MQRNAKNEIRIVVVQPEIKSDLENIAYNKGISLSSFLKPLLREIRDSFPDHMRIKKPRN